MDGMDVKLTAEPWRDNIDRDMSLTEHLTELRSCLFKAGAALVAGTAVSFYYLEQIIAALTAPVGQLYYLRPAEAFMVYLKIALLAGLILASPMVLYKAGVNPAGKALCSLHYSHNYSAFSWWDGIFLLSSIS